VRQGAYYAPRGSGYDKYIRSVYTTTAQNNNYHHEADDGGSLV
jgi:hypothetical protein